MGRAVAVTPVALLLASGLVACDRSDERSAVSPPSREIALYQPETLAEAVLLGDRDSVASFLSRGADPNEREADGSTLLMRAIHGRFHTITDLLLANGAAVDAANSYGVTALYLAARAGDVVATTKLLRAGASANTELPSGETVLMTAAKSGNAATVRALLTGGADGVSVEQMTRQRMTPRVEGSGYGAFNSPPAGNYAQVNARDRLYGRNALMLAAAAGHAEVVRLLVEAGSELNARDAEGATALSLAEANGHLEVLDALGAPAGGP
jgi:ankyrin repeat protein